MTAGREKDLTTSLPPHFFFLFFSFPLMHAVNYTLHPARAEARKHKQFAKIKKISVFTFSLFTLSLSLF